MKRIVLGQDQFDRDILSQNLVRDENGNVFIVEDNSQLGGLDRGLQGDLGGGQVVVDPSALGDRILVRGNGTFATGVSATGRALPGEVTQDIQIFNEAGTSRNGF